jgi:hypothetical protein
MKIDEKTKTGAMTLKVMVNYFLSIAVFESGKSLKPYKSNAW